MLIKSDSKKIKEGDIFIALRGVEDDGHCYIEEAIKNGATKVIVEEGLYSVETLVVKNTRDYLIDYLKENYYDQIKDLKLIGITGTNGKTTTCFLIHQVLNKIGKKCGYIGTIGFYIDDKIKDLSNTTPDLIDIYEMLIECKENNCEYVTMEVSSHALDMRRVDSLQFDYAVFTNLTKDHLDYHLDMKNYAIAKQKLFYMLKENGKAIINNDSEFKDYFLIKENNNIVYGFDSGDYKITEYQVTDTTSTFTILNSNSKTTYECPLLGHHNIYNAMVTIIILEDIKVENIADLVKEFKAPIGRMETIIENDYKVIIDYAHTPDAMLNIIETVKKFCVGKIITIIGCGGDRDKTKRPEMAKIATSKSDYAIFTSDNPRSENPDEIVNDMIYRLDKDNYEIIINRKDAIKKGIQLLEKNDILLVLGKGHETYQVIGSEKFKFDDKEEVLDVIRR